VRVAAATGDAFVGNLLGNGQKFGVVVGRFNDLVTKLLLEGALETFQRHSVPRSDVDVSPRLLASPPAWFIQ
jgi:6,7-dimethyl-8-ribityllumazine synthase